MTKKNEKAVKNALLQAEKHGISDTFCIKNNLYFYAKFDNDNNNFVINFENIEISFRDCSSFLEFLRSL